MILRALIVSLFFTLYSVANAADSYKRPHDLLGIGAAEIDIIVMVDDDYLKRNLTRPYGISKGETVSMDVKTIDSLRENLDSFTLSPSGEVASTLYSFASLGGDAAFNSSIAEDEYGDMIKENMKELGVDILDRKSSDDTNTIINVVFVTKDGERTIVSSAKALPTITQSDVKYHRIKDYKAVIAEAFSWDNGQASKAILRAFNAAKKVGVKRVFMLSDVVYVKKYRAEFMDVLDRVDILFATENEIKTLTQTQDIESGIYKIAHIVPTIIITRGKEGAIVVHNSNITHLKPVLEQSKVVNTAGAGSTFAAGFLYGYLNGKSIEESGKLASQVAEYMIQQVGSKPKSSLSRFVE